MRRGEGAWGADSGAAVVVACALGASTALHLLSSSGLLRGWEVEELV